MRRALLIGAMAACCVGGCRQSDGGSQATGASTTGEPTADSGLGDSGPVDEGHCGLPDPATGCGDGICIQTELRQVQLGTDSCSLGTPRFPCYEHRGPASCAAEACLVVDSAAYVQAGSDDVLLWADCSLRAPAGWVSCANPQNPRPDICACICGGLFEPPDTGPMCGNGVLDQGEVCDGPLLGGGQCHDDCQGFDCPPHRGDCNGDPEDGCEQSLTSPDDCTACGNVCDSSVCSPEGCGLKVFLTDQSFTGDLGGLDGADAKCMTEANDARVYRAWLHDGVEGPLERFTPTNRAYVLDEDIVVAENFDQLMGMLDAPIDREYSGMWPDNLPGQSCVTAVWTNVEPGIQGGTEHCMGWTSEAPGPGRTGYWTSIGETWTSACTADCAETYRLYCFEQPE